MKATSSLERFSQKHLGGFDPAEPMFWRLRLPRARFEELEALVAEASHEDLFANPIAALCYLAEWYKWRYSPAKNRMARHFNPSGQEIKQLLDAAGIDAGQWVAVNSETGRHSWLYSVYVLGGLPVAHELNRKADNQFLRRLCRMYHGESVVGELDDSGRAEAFRKSLKPGGSLYGFIRDITSGQIPFAAEDIKDGLSPASLLIRRIVEANNEVLRDKFRLEWRISAPDGAEYFSRRICLNLLPEITGEGLHQYLMYDRVRMWGFSDPAALRWLEFGMRFFNKGKEVEEIPPFISYTNNYNADRGFLSMGVDRAVVVRDVPVVPFDEIEVYVVADNGETHVAQKFEVPAAMQLYATDIPCEWSDAVRPQHATAVIWRNLEFRIENLKFSAEYSCLKPRKFRNRRYGVGANDYCLAIIGEPLTLVDRQGNELTFYDRRGVDSICARRHDNTIRYVQGDKVVFVAEDEDGDEEEILLPLIMTRDDLEIRRVSTDEFGETVEEVVTPELIEFKFGARYEEWTDEVFPSAGRVRVRCTIRGRQLIKDFAFTNGVVWRDLRNLECKIENLKLADARWDIEPDKPIEPTVPVPIGNIYLDVWQPISVKEINRGDNCCFRTEEAGLTIPALTASELWTAIFSEEGYRTYQCSPLVAIYDANKSVDKIGKLMNGTTIYATDIDPTAPRQLQVCMAYPRPNDDKSKWLEWDYMPESKLHPKPYETKLPHNSVLFQDRSESNNPLDIYCPKRDVFAFKLKAVLEKASLLECFKTASKYKTYFFLFSPLERMTRQQFQEEIYEPLLKEYFGQIPPELKNELTRAAIELGFMTINE